MEQFFDEKEFKDSQEYNAEKMEFGMIHKLFDTALEALLWVLFWYVAIWNWMDGMMSSFGLCSDEPYKNDIMQAYMFTVMVTLIESFLNLPFSLYSTFVLEEKYGFNKTTPGTFVCDEIKKFVILLVVFAVIIPLLLWLVHISGPTLILNLAATSIAIVIILSLLIPTVIIPIFYTFTDLEDGELKDAILEEAKKTDVSVAEIKVIDGNVQANLGLWQGEVQKAQRDHVLHLTTGCT